MSLIFVPTPEYMVNLEDVIRFQATNAWERTLSNLWYPRVMATKPVDSRVFWLEWQTETAAIHQLGPHGSDMVYTASEFQKQALEHSHFGQGLQLYRDQMADRKAPEMASKWASETGSSNAYWPQRGATYLLQNGKDATKVKAYDGQPLFSKVHPLGGVNKGKTASNLHNGVPFTAENLARVTAYARSIQHGGGAPAGYVPTIVGVPSNYQFRVNQVLNAESYTDVLNTLQAAAASNTFKQAYQFEPPIVADELTTEPTVWYLFVPANQDAFDAGLLYVEREPFYITSYGPMDQVTLGRQNVFEWHNRGRNGFAAGIWYLVHRCESTGSLDSYLSALEI